MITKCDTRPPRFHVPLVARNRALYYLANGCGLTDELRRQLSEIATGCGDACTPDAAWKGMEWMRQRYRAAGETPPF
jgi:hypothetical protein